jgi:hypothetical protein
MSKRKNSSTFHTAVRYGIMDEEGLCYGTIERPELFSLKEARQQFEEDLNDMGQCAQIVKIRVTYEVLDYDDDAFRLTDD